MVGISLDLLASRSQKKKQPNTHLRPLILQGLNFQNDFCVKLAFFLEGLICIFGILRYLFKAVVMNSEELF